MKNTQSEHKENPVKKSARVLLRPDGTVHIAFASHTSVRATFRAVLDLFRSPMSFMEEGCLNYEQTTSEICRNGQKIIPLENILGLDLAYVTYDRQIVCEFSELLDGLLNNIGQPSMDIPLDMNKMLCTDSTDVLSDEKAFLLRYYLEVSRFLSEKEVPLIERDVKPRDEVLQAVMKIALGTFTTKKDTLKPKPKPLVISEYLPAIDASTPTPKEGKKDNSDFVGTKECAEILGISPQHVRNKIKAGAIKAIKDESGDYKINIKDIPKKAKTSRTEKPEVTSLKGSYEEAQRLMKENNYFTQAVAPFISSVREMYFYAASHREVFWDGRPALIVDIHPEYATKDGITNRQRINDNHSPVSPDSPDEEPFHLHHISKRSNGPIAITTTESHRENSKLLHQAPNDPDMDRPEFNMQRISFWKTYLEYYDKYGYEGIPYLNSPIDTKKSKK